MIVVADIRSRKVLIADNNGEDGWAVSPKEARFIADLCERAQPDRSGQAHVAVDNIGAGTLRLLARPDQLQLLARNLRDEAAKAEVVFQ